MSILAIDPGRSCTGLAWVQEPYDGIEVRSVRPAARSAKAKAREIVEAIPDICWDAVLIEIPQVYERGKSKGDPNDLIKLAVLVGNLEMAISAFAVREILPAAWKKQIPKVLHHPRIRARARYWRRASKDSLDALGLLLYGQDVLAAEAYARKKRNL